MNNKNTTEAARAQRGAARKYLVTNPSGQTFAVTLSGRLRWALERLREAGPRGCTPITHPAPRWAHYVFKLRGIGVEIETVTEPHGGAFPGHHARYVLGSRVECDGGDEDA